MKGQIVAHNSERISNEDPKEELISGEIYYTTDHYGEKGLF